jgi:hypothetical protein
MWAGQASAQNEPTPPVPAPQPHEGEPPAAAPAPPPASSASPGDAATLKNEVQALRAEVAALQSKVEAVPPAPPPPPPSPAPPAPASSAETKPPPTPPTHALGYEPYWPWGLPPEGMSFGGYLQSQYTQSNASQDQLAQGGALLNKDRFLIRRARVNVTGEWEYAAVVLEMDANTTSGPQVDLRKAEASLQYRPDRSKPPIVMATLGQFDTPFGYELVESPRTRWFMERSQASLAFWPGEPDLGLRLSGALAFFRWTIATLNGNPLGEAGPYALQDPLSAKDVLFRFGVDTHPREDLQLAADVSSIRGRGFHAGTDTTKSTLTWSDSNGNGAVDQFELSPVSATQYTPSQAFDHWAVGADVRVSFRWKPGVLKVYGEFVLASNMDRGLYVADPITSGIDQRELGYYVGFLQEITPYAVVGFRYDSYDPNSNAFDSRGGQLIPYNQTVTAASPLVGLTLPDRARLVFQYDFNRNALARDALGVPTNLKSNSWTLRLQVQL